MPRAVTRVQSALDAAGVGIRVRLLEESSRTATEAAAAVGCELGAIVKSLIFAGERTGRPLLALVSGRNRADVALLGEGFGEPVGRPDARFVREATGFAIGGVPPVAHSTSMRAVVDEDLMAYDSVWCAAGTPTSLFEIAPADLVRVTGGEVRAVAQRAQPSSPSSS